MSRTRLEDCESDEQMEDGPPPRKKQDVNMDAKDADINLLAMADLSQCKKDPGDVAVEKGLPKYIIGCWLKRTREGASFVVHKRGITRNDRGSPRCS